MLFWGILVSFVMFSIIVLVHEYGHYKTARIFGIHVEEFGLGIPPRAKKLWKNKTGTLFSLNWIPLGGFVKIAGESEVIFDYFNAKGKQLSDAKLRNLIEKGEDIFTKKGRLISLSEKKFILARIDNNRPGENFYEKNIFQKSAVLVAGVLMNFILAFIIFTGLFLYGVNPIGINTVIDNPVASKILPDYESALQEEILIEYPGIILSPIEGSIAEQSGIIVGDILVEVNGTPVEDIQSLQKQIQSSAGEELEFLLENSQYESCAEKINCNINYSVEIVPDENGMIGSYLGPNVQYNENFVYQYGLGESIKYGALETYSQVRLTLSGFGMLTDKFFTPETPDERQEAVESVAGPIGIVSVITGALSGGIVILLLLGALISINLGVFNLLPIPALDGGRLVLLWLRSAIDANLGKTRISGEIENMVHILFFIALIALSILIAYNDIIRLILD